MELQSNSEKLLGFEFWKTKLKSARMVVAPMVDQSELPWRLLSRHHGAQLCYTPMYHASVFVRDPHYRKEALASSEEDRPLIVQFCANDPETLLKAAQYAEGQCEAIDLNLGCPQAIAKRGHYGAFLQEEWDLLHEMVSLCAKKLKVPITCKVRIFEDVDKTVRYAQMLEKAGCQLLTVHGRTKDQKGPKTGIADWTVIKAIKNAVNIPVFANGNIQYLQDVYRCMEETGVDGVMSAEGNLHNPALFEGGEFVTTDLAEEYLDLVDQYPCPMSCVRGHMFKLFHHALLLHVDLREMLGCCKTVTDIKSFVQNMKAKCKADVELYKENPSSYREKHQNGLPHPYWICQPYVRPTPQETEERREEKHKCKRGLMDVVTVPDDKYMSRNKMKKLRRNPRKKFQAREEKFEKCSSCGNPKGLKCVFDLCKACCKKQSYKEQQDCPGHKIFANKKYKDKNPWQKEDSESNCCQPLDDGLKEMLDSQISDDLDLPCSGEDNTNDTATVSCGNPSTDLAHSDNIGHDPVASTENR